MVCLGLKFFAGAPVAKATGQKPLCSQKALSAVGNEKEMHNFMHFKCKLIVGLQFTPSLREPVQLSKDTEH